MARRVPFEKIVQDLRPERSLSRTPLFQVMFILHNTQRNSIDLPGLQFDELEFETGLAKFDLTLEVREEDGLYCLWEYSTDLFDNDRIQRMAGHFETLLRGLLAAPDSPLSELPILTSGEQNRLLVDGTLLRPVIQTISVSTGHLKRKQSGTQIRLPFAARIASSPIGN